MRTKNAHAVVSKKKKSKNKEKKKNLDSLGQSEWLTDSAHSSYDLQLAVNEVDVGSNPETPTGFFVKPRGPVRGFFNRDKLEQFAFFSR